MTTLVLIAVGYVSVVAFVLAILTVAKRADESLDRQGEALRGAVEALPPHGPRGRVAAEVREALITGSSHSAAG